MKRLLFTLLLLASLLSARAADRITATVTITNAPTTNGMTFVITTTGASTRTWTNSVVTPSVQILTNNTAPGVASNLQAHLEANPPAGVTSMQSSTSPTNLTIAATCGTPLTISGAGNYFSVTYATQACTAALTVRVPLTAEAAITQTNVASGLSAWLESSPNTNSIDQNSTAMSEVVGLTNAQTVSGIKSFTGANYHTGAFLNNPTLTNGVNYGSAFSSPVTNLTGSEQFGAGATATFNHGTAVGAGATAGLNSSAFGYHASAASSGSMALGNGATASSVADTAIRGTASGGNSIAIGDDAVSSGSASIAFGNTSIASTNYAITFGFGAVAAYSNSVAIGNAAATTADNQIMLGSEGVSTVIQNNGTIQSNATIGLALQVNGSINGVMGSTTNGTEYNPQLNGSTLQNFSASRTNIFPAGSDVSFGRYAITTLANGNNAGVIVGTNVFVEVSGPSGAFTINGLTASPNRDGRILILITQVGQTLTIANESGVDATAGNRIRTGYGADITVTNNPGCVQFIYSGAASRWLITSKTP